MLYFWINLYYALLNVLSINTISCLPDASCLLVLCGSSSRCHGLVCSVWLWYFLVTLTFIWRINSIKSIIADMLILVCLLTYLTIKINFSKKYNHKILSECQTGSSVWGWHFLIIFTSVIPDCLNCFQRGKNKQMKNVSTWKERVNYLASVRLQVWTVCQTKVPLQVLVNCLLLNLFEFFFAVPLEIYLLIL